MLKGKWRKDGERAERGTVETMDAMLRRSWELEGAPEGLWQAIRDVIDAFAEHRMASDYGDYLAVSLDRFRVNLPDAAGKGLKWTKVAEIIEREQGEMEELRRRFPKSNAGGQEESATDTVLGQREACLECQGSVVRKTICFWKIEEYRKTQ